MRELDLDLLRERLSPKAIRVLSFSIEESRRRNHNFLSDEHILLALCKNEPGLIQDSLCCAGLNLENLITETKNSLDKTQPRVGRSLNMTPELKRTLRNVWENIQQKNRNHIETFDLLEALQQNGTSHVWQMIRQTGSEEQIHSNLEKYAKTYFEKRTKRDTADKDFEPQLVHSGRQSPIPAILRVCSLALTCAIFALFVLAIMRC